MAITHQPNSRCRSGLGVVEYVCIGAFVMLVMASVLSSLGGRLRNHLNSTAGGCADPSKLVGLAAGDDSDQAGSDSSDGANDNGGGNGNNGNGNGGDGSTNGNNGNGNGNGGWGGHGGRWW